VTGSRRRAAELVEGASICVRRADVVGVLFHVILMRIVRIGLFDWALMFLYLAFLLPFDRPAAHRLPGQKDGEAIPDDAPALRGA
jgi:hypothetical protein